MGLIMRRLPWFAIGLCLLGVAPAGWASSCQHNIAPTNPDSAYQIRDNGVTALDTRTGLLWKRCAEGQNWDGSSCSGSASTFDWQQAFAAAASATTAGYTDWRLPNRNELQSLVEYCRTWPAINTTVFPNTPSSDFWSGSPYANYSSSAWNVYFYNGYAYGNDRGSFSRVRLVRGGQSFAPSVPPPMTCTSHTLGIDDVCYYQPTKSWTAAFLRVNGTIMAHAYLAGNVGGFCPGGLIWLDATGMPITDWSMLFNGSPTATVDVLVRRHGEGPGDPLHLLATETARQSAFDVQVTVNHGTLENAAPAKVDFTAQPQGGTAPYTYEWDEGMDFAANYGYLSWGSSQTVPIELPYSGQDYSMGRWNHYNLHVIELQVTDSASQMSHVKCLAAVARPPEVGNPALSGSGSLLMRGVDMASGNFHRSVTDFSVPALGPDFTVTRAYNALTNDWSFNLDMEIRRTGSGREMLVNAREDGHRQRFYLELDGTWRSLNPGNFDQLVQETDGSYTLYTQGSLIYHFADPDGAKNGRLESIVDRQGNALTFSHDANNRITGATDASGHTYTVQRDAQGRITKVADFTGRNVQYVWDGYDMITTATNVLGQAVTYTYDLTKLTTVTDPRGHLQLSVEYYNRGRAKKVTDGDGNAWSYYYGTANGRQASVVIRPTVNGVNNSVLFYLNDARSRVTERVDAGNPSPTVNALRPEDVVQAYAGSSTGFSHSFQYKQVQSRARIAGMSLITKQTLPSGTATDFGYSDGGHGNLQQVTDALGRQTDFTYTSISGQRNLTPVATLQVPGVANPVQFGSFTTSGLPTAITDPLGHTTHRSYTGSGLLDTVTDALGHVTDFTYGPMGRVTRVTDALGQHVDITYDSLGRVATVTDRRNHTTHYYHDAAGNLTRMVDANGQETKYFRDASGNLTKVLDPRGNATEYVYDNLNRLSEVHYTADGVARVRRFEYDAMGRLYRVINENNNATERHFDARGHMLERVNPLSQSVTYTYDDNGRPVTVTDAEGRSVSYQYDVLGRITRATDALGNYVAYTYNNQGLVATRRDGRGQTTSYEYDDLGHLTKVTAPGSKVTTATYDANGNLASVTDAENHTTQYTYDALDRLVKIQDAMNKVWQFAYDANGNLSTRTLPDNSQISYVYDALNRVTKVTYPNQVVQYTYDANGNRLSMSDATGQTSYTYDELNRLVSMTDGFGNSVGWDYGPVGHLQTLTYPGNHAVDYAYNAAGRMTSVTDWLGDITSYSYDGTGRTLAVQYANGTDVSMGYDGAGRLISLVNHDAANGVISSHSLTLDGAGLPTTATLELPLSPANLPNDTASMIYDSSNRLVTFNGASMVNDANGRLIQDPSATQLIEYTYNAQDLITSVSKGGTTTGSYLYNGDGWRVARTHGGQTTRYALDPTGGTMYRVLAETDVGNNPQHYYIYGAGGSLVSQVTGTSHRYYHFDPRGNTIALTDDAGSVTDRYAYTPYGLTTSQGATHNPFRFVGRYGVMDDANGLLYMRARYYRPDLRRFVSLDPIRGRVVDPMSRNRYVYVHGNPLINIDPTGLSWREISEGIKEFGYNVKTVSYIVGKKASNAYNYVSDKTAEAVKEFPHNAEIVSDYIQEKVANKTNAEIKDINPLRSWVLCISAVAGAISYDASEKYVAKNMLYCARLPTSVKGVKTKASYNVINKALPGKIHSTAIEAAQDDIDVMPEVPLWQKQAQAAGLCTISYSPAGRPSCD